MSFSEEAMLDPRYTSARMAQYFNRRMVWVLNRWFYYGLPGDNQCPLFPGAKSLTPILKAIFCFLPFFWAIRVGICSYRLLVAVIPISGRFVPQWEQMNAKRNTFSTQRLFRWPCNWKIIRRKQANILCTAQSSFFGMPIENYIAVLWIHLDKIARPFVEKSYEMRERMAIFVEEN